MSLGNICEDCLFIIFYTLSWEELLELRLVNKYIKIIIDKYLINKYKKNNIIDAIKELCTEISINDCNTKYLYKGKYHNNNGPALIEKVDNTLYQSYFNHGNPINVVPNVKILPQYYDYIKTGVHSIVYDEQGNVTQISIKYNKYIILYRLHNIVLIMQYTLNGKLHNDNGAACVMYHPNGNLKRYSYEQNCYLHRVGGPAVEEFSYDNERILERRYYYNGMEHNDNGPSYIGWYLDGGKHTIGYKKEGKYHRIGKPALFYFYSDGSLAAIYYYYEGKLHNDDGPALVKWYPNGYRSKTEYYTHGVLN